MSFYSNISEFLYISKLVLHIQLSLIYLVSTYFDPNREATCDFLRLPSKSGVESRSRSDANSFIPPCFSCSDFVRCAFYMQATSDFMQFIFMHF